MLRILLIDLESQWRGGQEQALLLMKGLRALGHTPELLTQLGSALATRAGAEGLSVHTSSPSATRIAAALQIRSLLRASSFDVAYANEPHALTAAWLAGAHHRLPIVAARRVVFPLSRSRIALARYRAASFVIAISQAVRSELIAAKLDPAKIKIVPDGVEIPKLLTPEARRNPRERWRFVPNDFVLAYVASLTGEKGHTLLIQAFELVQKHIPNCRLLLAGDGPLRDELERQARAANLSTSITFAGFVEDVDAVYAAADLFVFPSSNEGLGTSLLRAMAFGLPVVAFSQGGIGEVIENGCTGILVQKHDAESLAAALTNLFSNAELAGELGKAARVTASSRFCVDRMAEDTLHLLKTSAASHKRRSVS